VDKEEKRIRVVFFCTSSGHEPVREWLLGLNPLDKKAIGTDIKTVEFGWPIGMPVCRSLGAGLWEVRSNLSNRIARIMFCISDGKMVLLHGFIKKSKTAPKKDIELAMRRMRELEH
jgi:phage-related protein